MIQFYFLSIVLNLVSGFVLAGDNLGQKVGAAASLRDYFTERGTAKLVLALLTMVTGLFKILSVTRGDVVVVGDLLPALVGISMGGILGLEYYTGKSSETEELGPFFGFLVKNRQIIGYAGIIVAIVHFLFPGVLFL